MLNPDRSMTAVSRIYVWDPFVRLFHWTLVVAFTVAYLTEDDLLNVHVWAGYVVGGLVVARIDLGLRRTGSRPLRRFHLFAGRDAALRARSRCCSAPNAISATAQAAAPWWCSCSCYSPRPW